MQLEQLRQVIAIAETGSMNKAAKKLFLSQPNISSSMKALEKEVGQQIFDRSHGAARLTPFGEMFLKHAYAVNEKMNNLEDFCETQETVFQPLDIVSYHMPEAYAAYVQMLNRYDGMYVYFTYRSGHVRFVLDQLLAGHADLGLQLLMGMEKEIVLQALRYTDWEYRSLSPSPLGVLLGPNHPYCHREGDTLSLSDIKHYPQIISNTIDDLMGLEQKSWTDYQRYGLRSVEVTSQKDLENLLLSGEAFVLCTWHRYQEILATEPECRFFHIREGLDACEIGYIFNRRTGLSHVAEEYLGILKENLAKNPLLG